MEEKKMHILLYVINITFQTPLKSLFQNWHTATRKKNWWNVSFFMTIKWKRTTKFFPAHDLQVNVWKIVNRTGKKRDLTFLPIWNVMKSRPKKMNKIIRIIHTHTHSQWMCGILNVSKNHRLDAFVSFKS